MGTFDFLLKSGTFCVVVTPAGTNHALGLPSISLDLIDLLASYCYVQ